MPVKARPRPHYTKTKPPKRFLKVYWPYLPLTINIALSLILSFQWQPFRNSDVLAYATNMSVSGLLDATNKQRTSYGKVKLKLNSKLNSAATAKANDMAKRDYWSHVTPDGKQPWYFIDQAGYNYQKAGENLAYGFDSSSAAVSGWMNSASHKANLLDGQFLDVGFGIANGADYQDNGNQTIVVAMYGRVLGASTSSPAPSSPKTSKASPSSAPAPSVPTTLKVEEPVVNPETLGGREVELPSQNISIVQALTAGQAPWSSFAMGALMSGLVVYLLMKHGLGLRRVLRRSERFILRHALLDATIVSFLALGFILTQTTGVIR